VLEAAATKEELAGGLLAIDGKFWQSFPSYVLGARLMPDEILTLAEVALLLKVAEKTVYTMAQGGEVPAFKVRGQWRFKRDDLDHWIEQQKLLRRDYNKPNGGRP